MNRDMRNTGNDCLSLIPASWQSPRLKYYCKISNGSDPQTEGGIPAYGSGKEVVKYCGEYKTGPAILLGRKGTLDNPRYVEGKFWNVDTAMDAYPINGINPKYLFFVTKILDIQRYATSTAKPSMTQSDYYNMPIPLPRRDEQDSIVCYIDSKCAAIDEAIERHKKIIEKLENYRKILITHTVTKGLVKNRPMKRISVDWIGGIPADWDYIKITWILDNSHPYPIGDGDHGIIKTEDYQENGIPYIRVQNLGWGTPINTDSIVYISEEMNAKIANSTLRPGDVLFAKTGATIGKTAFVSDDMPVSNTTSHVGKITISPKHNAKYIFYVLSSYVGYKQFWDFADMKATRPELAISEIKTIKVTLPRSRTEQDEIVAFLDSQTEKISKLIDGKKATINKLEEYRKSIIYNAVTGKIDCRKSA